MTTGAFKEIVRGQMRNTGGGFCKPIYEFVTVGTVVDTNDPQQNGRLKAVCPNLGDSFTTNIDYLPWCLYGASFGGKLSIGSRGPSTDTSEGSISYGTWWVPKPGAQVLVICIDGDPMQRVWIGCLYDPQTAHTMPHGRWKYEDHPELQKSGSDARPFGPYTTTEKFIEPLNTNLRNAFGNKSEPNFEWRTRAADYQVSAIDVEDLQRVYSKVQDDKDFTWDDWISRQGYQINRADPRDRVITGKNYDNMVYSITSPGFHAFSMDDRMENCRIRIRTTSGHQIIMDDTNERIYIQTAEGKTWLEMDQQGNVDLYVERRFSVHAKKDINFTSDETIRLQAKKGINMFTDDEIRMQAKKDIHVRTEQNLRVNAFQSLYLQSGQQTHIKAGQEMFIQAAQDLNVLTGAQLKLTSGGASNISAGGNLYQTAPEIHLNGPAAAPAGSAESPNEEKAKWTSRVPQHEAWARTVTKDDYTHEPEFPYDSKEVNRVERGETLSRGRYWRR